MGADIKNLRTRIKSVDSTLHLTTAMGLVASSKIRKATRAMNNAKEYVDAINEVFSTLSNFPECKENAFMKEKEGKERIIVIAGDKGLAGGYNQALFKMLKDYSDAEIITIGKKACEKFGREIVNCEHITLDKIQSIINKQCSDFLDGKISKLGIISTRYISMLKQEPTLEWVLPLKKSEQKNNTSMIFEPNADTVLSKLVPELLCGKLSFKLKESFLCEVAARRMAMDSASKNAKEMIDDLKLKYNRARQSTITQEITEIVAGSDS